MMATEDIRPKKKLGENIFGTSVKKAEGAKTARPGDANTSSAKMEKVMDLPRQVELRELRAKESMLSEAAKKLAKKGFQTFDEHTIYKRMKPKGSDI